LRSHYPFDELIYLYKLVNFVSGNWRPFQETADTAIRRFHSEHPPRLCTCTWGISHSGGWTRFEPATIPKFWSYQCPYEFATSELYSEWFDLLPGTTMQRNKALDCYESFAFAVARTGIASITGRASGKTSYGSTVYRRPLLKFNWSDRMTCLIEDILAKAILAHVDELKQWLSTIESGLSPDYRDRFPPNIYLVQYGQPGLQLICWPTGTLSPSKYPDITLLESGKNPPSAQTSRD
jgi:hypothetical protein